MRWSQFFADLESQADALATAELDSEVAERTRIEVAALPLADRLRAAEGRPVGVDCGAAGILHGRLARGGGDWLLLADGSGRETVVALGAVLSVSGLPRWSAAQVSAAESLVSSALGLRHALRALARDRAAVRLVRVDGTTLAGTVDRVGRDFLELAEHPLGEPRRPEVVSRVWTVPLTVVALVRRW
jgi:hypothetical protein